MQKVHLGGTLAAYVVFVNARRASHRVGLEAAKIINAIVHQEILNYPPWVREADGEPASKRPRTEDEVQRKDTITPLRPLLRGNENRRNILKVFFDAVFSRNTDPCLIITIHWATANTVW